MGSRDDYWTLVDKIPDPVEIDDLMELIKEEGDELGEGF